MPQAINVEVAGCDTICRTAWLGFDLAGDESRFNNLAQYEGDRLPGLNGLTCHAAEAAPGAAAREAVERFGVTRIGHGAHLAEDVDALTWVRDHGIVVECCPTSNWYTGAIRRRAEHPARYFRDQRLEIVLGDDNPMQTRSLLSNERRVLTEELGFGEGDLAELDRVSVRVAFLEASTREEFVSRQRGGGNGGTLWPANSGLDEEWAFSAARGDGLDSYDLAGTHEEGRSC